MASTRTYTYARTGNRFDVIDPAPSIEEFLAGTAALRNAYDLEITLDNVHTDTLLDRISADGALDRASVRVQSDTGYTGYAYVSGTYTGVGSELWLTT